MSDKSYSLGEEIFSAVTHGIGAVLSMFALVLLIVFSAEKGTVWHIVSFSIYGAAMVILYLGSTLYHSFTNLKVKKLFRKIDHMSIYILIAGTYTPFCLTVLRGPIGFTILGVVWSCAVFGIVAKAFNTGKKNKLSTLLYVIMGWIIILAFRNLYNSMPSAGLIYLVAGGLAYTFGALVYLMNKIKFNHGIWHLFVLAGSAFHFLAVLTLMNI